MSIRPRNPLSLPASGVVPFGPGHLAIPRPVNSWRSSASLASHPSLARENVPLIEAIAGGLARVAVPWELRADDDRLAVELVLTTDRYDAWVVHWQPGSFLDVRPLHPASCAVAIVSGMLDEQPVDQAVEAVGERREVNDGCLRLEDGSSRFVSATSPRLLVNDSDRVVTSVHVHSPPLVGPHPVPRLPPPTPNP